MLSLNAFLEKFKNITQPDEAVIRLLSETIKKEAGVEIPTKNISIKNSNAYIKTKSLYKNEIYIKKEKILLSLKKLPEGKHITNIL